MFFYLTFYESCFFITSRRRHTRLQGDWSSDVCSSDLIRRATLKTLIGAAVGSILGIIGAFLIGSLISNQESMAVAPEEIGRASCREREGIRLVACTYQTDYDCSNRSRNALSTVLVVYL